MTEALLEALRADTVAARAAAEALAANTATLNALTAEIRGLRTDLQAYRDELRGLRSELLPVVKSVQEAGGIRGLVDLGQKLSPLLDRLQGGMLGGLFGGKRKS